MQTFFDNFDLLRQIFREISVEKYKEFKGVNFCSMRARNKVLANLVKANESSWHSFAF